MNSQLDERIMFYILQFKQAFVDIAATRKGENGFRKLLEKMGDSAQ